MSVGDAAPARAERAPLDEERQARIDRYVALLVAQNATLNLTAARTPQALADHVRDSLSIAPFLREPFVDVGSGGGFPAIPLAIATGYRGVLVESVLKKARFLEQVVRELDLPLEVRAVRAEDAGRDPALRERFASATARAVASLPAVLEFSLPLLEIGGLAVLQRGRLEPRERAAAADAALVLGGKIEDEVTLDAYDERRVVLVRKLAAIGQRFPRRAGVPAKRPLCYDAGGDD